MRIYVLIYGVNPLRLYIFEDGLARFATIPYELPNAKNLNNMFMHLTNYAINKFSNNYQPNENAEGCGKSHKRSLKEIYKHLEGMGHDSQNLSDKIDDLIIKTVITG
jgi:tubulin polyglutamylase TTLL6/13